MAKKLRAIFLTPEDEGVLQRLIANDKLKPQNTLPDPVERPRNLSKSVFVALPQTEITALTSSGTGTTLGAEEGDHPGVGLCEIFRIADGELRSLGGRLERVYNSSRSTISREWIQVHQDRFGEWWAITASAAGVAGTQIILGTPMNDNPTGTGVSHGAAFVDEEITCEVASGANFGDKVSAWVRKGMVIFGADIQHYMVAIDGAVDNDADYEILDPLLEFIGYTNTDVSKGGTVNVQIWRGAPLSGIFLYTQEDILVECNYGDVVAGSLVRCRWIEGLAWEIVNAECDVSGTGT